MTSLKRRLGLGLVISLALFFVLLSFIIGHEVAALSEANMLSRLRHDQEQIIAALQGHTTPPQLNGEAIPAIYQRPFSGHYFQIDGKGWSVRSRSLWDEALPTTPASITRDFPGPKGQPLLITSRNVRWHGQSLRVSVAEEISRIEASATMFQKRFLLFSAGAILLLLLIQEWLVTLSLRPLQHVRKQLTKLDKGELDSVTAPTPAEITPLVDEINRLMRLMRRRLTRSRHALGDLAHSLKTPLAIARQIVTRQREGEDRSALERQLSLIEERIETELARARTAGPMAGRIWCNIQHDLTDIKTMLQQLHPDISIDLKIEQVNQIHADREDMLELIGNLLENGCKWGRNTVRCTISRNDGDGGDILIQVEDDGPGVNEDDIAGLLARGTRADESMPGHGLGLAIVHATVQAYEGDMTLSRAPELRGLRVRIRIP